MFTNKIICPLYDYYQLGSYDHVMRGFKIHFGKKHKEQKCKIPWVRHPILIDFPKGYEKYGKRHVYTRKELEVVLSDVEIP